MLRPLVLLSFATLTLAGGPESASLARPAPADDATQTSTLVTVARAGLEELDAYRDTARSRRNLLVNTLSRYLAVYQVPSDLGELDRLLGTSSRIALRFARELYEEAARRSSGPLIDEQPMIAATQALLPSRSNPYNEIVYFPEAPPPDRVVLETWDLDAYLGTGAPFEVLLELGEELAARDASPTLSIAAATHMARAVTGYGLLVLRIGGRVASAQLAEELGSHHLREAAKTLSARRTATADPPTSTPVAGSIFSDVTAASGIRFRHVSSAWISQLRRLLPRTTTFSGGGVSAADLDGDDWPDLVVCGGRGCALYINRRDGTFEDATSRSGIRVDGEARMPLPADLDNDGDQDLFITYVRDTNRLFENRGDATFVDVTAEAGLELPDTVSSAAIALDVDGDALLDLYVGGFGDYLEGEVSCCGKDATNGLPNRLYRNLGDLRFAEIGQGTAVANTGWAQAISHGDLDRDGDQDIYIANDFGRNDLLLNNGDGTFESAGARAGVDEYYHGMNVSFADLNADLAADIFVTNIWHWHPLPDEVTETNSLYLSTPSDDAPVYERVEDPEFVGRDSGWSWAGLFFDFDLDTDDDLFVSNGFNGYFTAIQHRRHPEQPDRLYPINNSQEANLLLENETGLPTRAVEGFGAELADVNSRSAALLDYDRDGDLDLALTTFHSDFHLFRNIAPRDGNGWLVVQLVGDPARGSNREAIGAVLEGRTPTGETIWRSVTGGEGYLGRGTAEIHLGLGSAESVDLEIVWPSGARQRHERVGAGRAIRIIEGRQEVEALWE